MKIYWLVGDDNDNTVPVVCLERLFLILHTGYSETVTADAVFFYQLFCYCFCTLFGQAAVDIPTTGSVVGKACYGSLRLGELLHVIGYGKHVHFLIGGNIRSA